MKIQISLNYSVEVSEFNLSFLVSVFRQLIPLLLSGFISSVMRQLSESIGTSSSAAGQMLTKETFRCPKCGSLAFIWKTRGSSTTRAKVLTEIGPVEIPQMQIQCRKCGRKTYITRKILGLERYAKMTNDTAQKLALCGSLSSFRVCEVFWRISGFVFSRSTIWRCVQKVGESLRFAISPDEKPVGQADGTGIPVHGAGKRGSELKVLIQQNKAKSRGRTGSAWRIAGIDIGPYNGAWEKLFAPSLEAIKKFGTFFLITDGDNAIRKGLDNVFVTFQRCLWHIPHQLKHCLWQDKVQHKGDVWEEIMGMVYHLVSCPRLLDDPEIVAFLAHKKMLFEELLDYCLKLNCTHCHKYLQNARDDLFAGVEKRLEGKASSIVERVMRTVNMRIDFGKWSKAGALNATKVRLAFYYNGFDPSRTNRGKKAAVTVTTAICRKEDAAS